MKKLSRSGRKNRGYKSNNWRSEKSVVCLFIARRSWWSSLDVGYFIILWTISCFMDEFLVLCTISRMMDDFSVLCVIVDFIFVMFVVRTTFYNKLLDSMYVLVILWKICMCLLYCEHYVLLICVKKNQMACQNSSFFHFSAFEKFIHFW
jgi:hypothetical protein